MVNKKIKHIAKSIGTLKQMDQSHIVTIQLHLFIPVGTAMIMVAAGKQALVSTSKPTVYMWWAQTMNHRKPIETIA
jgi:hypothetical protein